MPRTVFRGANLLDGTNPAVAGNTVVIEGQRIAAVAVDQEFSPAPTDAIYELNGATLLPGMVQAHWHGSYHGLDFEPAPVGLERPPGYLMLLAAKQARMALDYGFTGVIGAATGDALDAQLKTAIADNILVGPRIMASGRWLITTGDSNDLPEFWWWGITAEGSQRICDGANEFRKAVRQEIKEGAEIIKIFSDSGHALIYGTDFVSMIDDELKAVVEAAHHRGAKVRSHVTSKKNILACIAAGVDVLDHADWMDDECIEAMVQAGTYVCPSLWLPHAIIERLTNEGQGDEPFVATMRTEVENMRTMLPRATAAGVKLMVGDDWGTAMTPHGDYNKEMQLYVEDVGIKPLDVLRWATLHGTECMGLGSELGTIAEGKLADLVIVNGDPSEDIGVLGDPANIQAVMRDGTFVKEPQKDQ